MYRPLWQASDGHGIGRGGSGIVSQPTSWRSTCARAIRQYRRASSMSRSRDHWSSAPNASRTSTSGSSSCNRPDAISESCRRPVCDHRCQRTGVSCDCSDSALQLFVMSRRPSSRNVSVLALDERSSRCGQGMPRRRSPRRMQARRSRRCDDMRTEMTTRSPAHVGGGLARSGRCHRDVMMQIDCKWIRAMPPRKIGHGSSATSRVARVIAL